MLEILSIYCFVRLKLSNISNKYIQQNIQHFLSNSDKDVCILHCFVHISFSDFFKSGIFISLLEIKTWKTPRKTLVYGFIIPAYVLFSWCMMVKYLLANVKKWVRIFSIVVILTFKSWLQRIHKPINFNFFLESL